MEQLHAGKLKGCGPDVWHTRESDGKIVYWCGSWHERSPQELFNECLTVIIDLLRNHPDVADRIKKVVEAMPK